MCLVAQLLGWIHLVAVEHARCPEHGEVLHVTERAAGTALARELHATEEAPTSSVETAPPELHADDHCGWLADRRDARLAPTVLAMSPSPRGEACSTAPAPLPCASSAPLYRLAPKQSPPTWS